MSLDIYLEIDVDTGGPEPKTVNLFSANITHNLTGMADAAGVYKIVWRPDEAGIATAGEMVSRLEAGIATMKADPAKFRALEPENKWGTYDRFVPWLEELLEACKGHPRAKVRSRR